MAWCAFGMTSPVLPAARSCPSCPSCPSRRRESRVLLRRLHRHANVRSEERVAQLVVADAHAVSADDHFGQRRLAAIRGRRGAGALLEHLGASVDLEGLVEGGAAAAVAMNRDPVTA